MVSRKQVCGKVLLADDGSEHARAAVALVSDLPLPPECRITVLRVFGSQQASELGQLEEVLAQTCKTLRARDLRVESELLLGSPAQKITEYVEEHKVNLIVLGAQGLRATLGILLGGVAQQVVEYSACPVLVVRTPYRPVRRVLLAVDGSACSRQALDYLGKFPLPVGCMVRVMHILPPPPLPVILPITHPGGMPIEPLPVPEESAALRAQEEQEGDAMLAKAVERLEKYGLPARPVLKRGDAATEIIEYVKEQGIDLIVTGSRGFGQVKSWLMGSVSRKLVHYSGCSVLVVRGPHEA
jgi:nucleotide-binding universal stress UspA family protein